MSGCAAQGVSAGGERSAHAAPAQRTREACFQALDPNASQKTGLAFGNRNGWQDFRFREKFLEMEEIEKRFQAENQGFRGFRERKGALS